MLDATIVRAHQHSAGAKRGTQNPAIGRSRGGLSTKIHIAVDALGHPMRMTLTAGQVHEATQASILIEGLTLISLIADKGYDNDAFRSELAAAEVDVVVPLLSSRTAEIAYDKNAYGLRYRIECFINKIKHYAGSQLATKRPRATFSRWSASPQLWSGCVTWSECQQALGPSGRVSLFHKIIVVGRQTAELALERNFAAGPETTATCVRFVTPNLRMICRT